jgi:hypothetical protein
LSGQKGFLSALIPAGFSFGTLGLGNWFGNDTETVNVPPNTPTAEAAASPKIDVNRSGATHEIT